MRIVEKSSLFAILSVCLAEGTCSYELDINEYWADDEFRFLNATRLVSNNTIGEY